MTNLVSSNGGVVHQGVESVNGTKKACGSHNTVNRPGYISASRFVATSAEVTCKRCLKKAGIKVTATKSVKNVPASAVREPVAYVPMVREMGTCRNCSHMITKSEETNNEWAHIMGITKCLTGETVAEA